MGVSQSVEQVREHLRGKPVVVVLGGGFAGRIVASQLETHANVIMIERRDHFYFSIAAPRATVDFSVAHQMTIPYTNVLKHGIRLQAEVTEVTKEGVKLQGHDELIRYDYLVIATGYGNTFPGYIPPTKASEVLPLFEETSKSIKEVSFPSSKPLVSRAWFTNYFGLLGQKYLGDWRRPCWR